MSSLKVSIILTSYNHEKHLREAIDSVLTQTFPKFELIIWDDASTDKSWAIIQSYNDLRIRAFRNEINQVGIANINKAISEEARGEYIAMYHSDDVWEPEKLEKQVVFLDENPDVGAVFTQTKLIDEDGNLFDDETHHYYKVFEQPNRTRHEWLNHFFYKGNALCHPSVLIRKKCYEDVGIYRYGMAQLPDFDMWVRLVMKYEIHIMPEKLVRFRVHQNEGNSSSDRPDTRIRSQFESLQVLENYRRISKLTELKEIFPIAEKYARGGNEDIGFILGMIALETGTFPFTELFGLNLLFEALNDPVRAKKIKELYSFSHIDFLKLTATHDVFSVEARNRYTYLTEIMRSETWKMVLIFRRVREKLLPIGSQREKIAKRGYLAIKIWRHASLKSLILKIKKKLIVGFEYQYWIHKNEPGKEVLEKQRTEKFHYRPLVSVIMPVWNTPVKILEQTIISVVEQTYDKWELCIADGNSNAETQKLLKAWGKKEPRIKTKFLNENKGIAVNTNKALSLARGEFVAFLDHDDLLAPFALFEIIKKLDDNPEIDIIYSDEDKIRQNGQRFSCFFKPDFSLDYLRSINYMTHFYVMRKSLGDEIGWLRDEYDGAQDYDLILRAVEKTKKIEHLSKILYHWRVSATSTADGVEVKPYANEAGKKILKEHLKRIDQPAQVVDGYFPTWYRVNYQHTSTPLISIIIPTRDHSVDLEQTINSILEKTTYSNFEIILIENGSTEKETFELYKQLEQDNRIRILVWKQPFNYSLLNNWAVEQANGDVLLFLNNDMLVINKDWLEEMLQFALRPDVGAVGAKLYYPDGTIQHGGVILGIGGVAGHSHKYFPKNHPGYFGRLMFPHNVSALTAACLMVKKQVFRAVDGFDKNYPLAFGDVDLCLKILEKKYLNIWTPYAELYHYESKTRGGEVTREQKKRFSNETKYFQQKWESFLKEGDPYYNPNLTLAKEDFSLNLLL